MRKYVRELPVRLSDPEKADRAQQLAKVELETQSTEADIEDTQRVAREEIKAYRGKLTGQRELCRRLARAVKNGEEFRNIEVLERLSEDSTEVETIRIDINEVVDRRAATDQDRQMKLDDLVDDTLERVTEDTEAAEPGSDEDTDEDDDLGEDEATV